MSPAPTLTDAWLAARRQPLIRNESELFDALGRPGRYVRMFPVDRGHGPRPLKPFVCELATGQPTHRPYRRLDQIRRDLLRKMLKARALREVPPPHLPAGLEEPDRPTWVLVPGAFA